MKLIMGPNKDHTCDGELPPPRGVIEGTDGKGEEKRVVGNKSEIK